MSDMTPEKAQAMLDGINRPEPGQLDYCAIADAAPDLARTVIAQAAELTRLRAKVEAADKLAEVVRSFRLTCVADSFYKDCYLHFVAPHSLSMRVPVGSDKAHIVADLEARRVSALSAYEGAKG